MKKGINSQLENDGYYLSNSGKTKDDVIRFI